MLLREIFTLENDQNDVKLCFVEDNDLLAKVTCIISGVSNRWKPMIGKPIDQSIKLVNWYRLVSVNR